MNARALALGFFDGVHPAHRRVLALAREYADKNSLTASAVTFKTQPAAFVRGEPEQLLCTLNDRIRLLSDEGKMDSVVVLPFEEEMMRLPPEEFVDRILVSMLSARFVAAGFDYRFGLGGAGDAKLLSSLCESRGIAYAIAPEVRLEDEKISSSRIRALLQDGQAEKAARIMGRPFAFSGIVRHGKALGRTLGFPTLNVPLPASVLLPKAGVYLCRVRLRGTWHAGVCNISPERLCEVHMLTHNEDAYGVEARVELLSFTRPMRAFESWDLLKKQVDLDKESARNWFLSRPDGLF